MITSVRQPLDAIIVGAGPAGSALAILLAQQNWRVALIDAAGFPRQKVCGEVLGAGAMEPLAAVGVAAAVQRIAVPIQQTELLLPGVRGVSWKVRDELHPAVAVSRFQLDQLLVEAARTAGVEVLCHTRVRSVCCDRGTAVGVVVQPSAGGEHQELRAPLVVAADGHRSVVVRDTGRTRGRMTDLIGFKRHWRQACGTESEASTTLRMLAFPGGYIGVCAVEGGDLNICGVMPGTLLRAARGSVDQALAAWDPTGRLTGLLSGDPHGPWHTMPEVNCRASVPTCGGVLYVGDAAGTIEPLAGQGMTIALRSAVLAAEVLQRSGPAVDHAAQAEYQALWQTLFSRPIQRSQWFGSLLRRPGVFGPMRPLVERLLAARPSLLDWAGRSMRVA